MDYLIPLFIGLFLGGQYYNLFKAVYGFRLLIVLSVVFGLLGFALFSSVILSKTVIIDSYNTYATEMFLFSLMSLLFAFGAYR